MKFLVVDDSPTIRRLVIACLKNLEYFDILEAEDGRVALEIVNSNSIDIILTDWVMPNYTGLELTNAIRQNEKTKNIPIILITTKGEKKDILEAVKSKINGFIVKPFTPEILENKLKPILDKLNSKKNIVVPNNRISLNYAIQNDNSTGITGLDALISFKNLEKIDASKINLSFPKTDGKLIINSKLIIDGKQYIHICEVLDDTGNVLDKVESTYL